MEKKELATTIIFILNLSLKAVVSYLFTTITKILIIIIIIIINNIFDIIDDGFHGNF
jgi:phage-related holin